MLATLYAEHRYRATLLSPKDWRELEQEARELISSAFSEGGMLLLPLRCTVSNAGHTVRLLRDLGSIARDARSDLAELRSGAKDRLQLVFSQATSSSLYAQANGTRCLNQPR